MFSDYRATTIMPWRGRARRFRMGRMHFDEMIDAEQAERDPDRRRRAGADFKNGDADDSRRQQDLQVDIIIGGDFDFKRSTFLTKSTTARALAECSARNSA